MHSDFVPKHAQGRAAQTAAVVEAHHERLAGHRYDGLGRNDGRKEQKVLQFTEWNALDSVGSSDAQLQRVQFPQPTFDDRVIAEVGDNR